MAVSYNTTVKSSRITVVKDAIDAGSSGGTLEILTSGDALLASITLADPCGSVANGVLTLTTPRSATASGTGTAAKAQIKDSNSTVIVSGLTVGTSGADVIVGTTSISSGNTVNLTSASITHAT